jgi:hypothetical protein
MVFGVTGIADSPDKLQVDVKNAIAKALEQPITAGDIINMPPTEVVDRWLAADTFGLPLTKTGPVTRAVTLTDVQRVASEVSKRPMVTVVVKKANAN